MRIISERHRESKTDYERCFEYAPYCGYGFPCDKHGNILFNEMTDCAIDNYKDCINGKHPELTDVGVRKNTHTWTEDAIGICDKCGAKVGLYDEYCGACQCEKCGQWYAMNGQQIYPPTMWEETIEPEDYY